MKIRYSEVPVDEVLRKIETLQQQTDKELDNVPECVDVKILSNWLVPLKLEKLKESQVEVFPANLISESNDDTNINLKHQAEKILQQNNQVGYILFCAPYGNNAIEGFSETDSDDFLAVYAAPSEQVYNSLIAPHKFLGPPEGPMKHQKKGFCVYELESFLQLLIQGNHMANESLFLKKNQYWSCKFFERFLNHKEIINISHVMHYLGIS